MELEKRDVRVSLEKERIALVNSRRLAHLQQRQAEELEDLQYRLRESDMEQSFQLRHDVIVDKYDLLDDADDVADADFQLELLKKHGVSLPEKLFQ